MMPNITRGNSFKGLTAYLNHDKGKAKTYERVGWTGLANFAPGEAENAEEAALAMAAVWRNADRLKEAAGIKNTGRKATAPPVWHCSLSWYPGEEPSIDEMKAAAKEALARVDLGLERGYQTMIIQHKDEPQPHIHIVVNLVHPETGRRANPKGDRTRLQEWADGYDLARGNNFAKDRRDKYQERARKRDEREHAKAEGRQGPVPEDSRDQPSASSRKREFAQESDAKRQQRAGTRPQSRHHQNAGSRARWEAERKARELADQERYAASRAELAQIRATFDERYAEIKDCERIGAAAHRAASERLYQQYQESRQLLKASRQPEISAIYKHRRTKEPSFFTRQGWRDRMENHEWRALGRRLYKERRKFIARERTMSGRFANSLILALAGHDARGRAGLLRQVLRHPEKRLQYLALRESLAKQALSQKHFESRRRRAEPLRATLNQELAALYEQYRLANDALKEQEAARRRDDRAAQAKLRAERAEALERWRKSLVRPFERAADPATRTRPQTPTPEKPRQGPTPWSELSPSEPGESAASQAFEQAAKARHAESARPFHTEQPEPEKPAPTAWSELNPSEPGNSAASKAFEQAADPANPRPAQASQPESAPRTSAEDPHLNPSQPDKAAASRAFERAADPAAPPAPKARGRRLSQAPTGWAELTPSEPGKTPMSAAHAKAADPAGRTPPQTSKAASADPSPTPWSSLSPSEPGRTTMSDEHARAATPPKGPAPARTEPSHDGQKAGPVPQDSRDSRGSPEGVRGARPAGGPKNAEDSYRRGPVPEDTRHDPAPGRETGVTRETTISRDSEIAKPSAGAESSAAASSAAPLSRAEQIEAQEAARRAAMLDREEGGWKLRGKDRKPRDRGGRGGGDGRER